MKQVPKISIVTPTFNQGQYIEQTILSVLDQAYPNLEYLIIDGGSTDNTVEIIKKYNKHLAYWVSEKDRGQSHAINKGLERCTGDVFNWINSDDYYAPGVFDRVAECFSNDTVNMLCGRSHIFGGEKEWVSDGTKLPDAEKNVWVHPSIDQPATFFRKKIIDDFGPLTEGLHYTMDLEWLLKFWLKYGRKGMEKVTDVFVHFREHPGSKTVQFQERFSDERLKQYRAIMSHMDTRISPPSDYHLKGFEKNIPDEWIYKTFNRYIFTELQRYYGNRWFKKFKSVKTLLREEYLNESDRKMYGRQKTRAVLAALFSGK